METLGVPLRSYLSDSRKIYSTSTNRISEKSLLSERFEDLSEKSENFVSGKKDINSNKLLQQKNQESPKQYNISSETFWQKEKSRISSENLTVYIIKFKTKISSPYIEPLFL